MIGPWHWQVLVGCSFASTGCSNCHALALAKGDLRTVGPDGRRWTGKVRLDAGVLHQPLAYSAPLEIAVATRSDLFHEAVPVAWLDRIFDVIDRTPQHCYQVLTKRPARMQEYVTRRTGGHSIPNVVFGVSAERDQEARERIPHLLETPAIGRFVVFYPLLGPVNLLTVLGPVYRFGAISIAAIGDEPQRPASSEWIEHLTGQCERLGMIVTKAQPDHGAIQLGQG